MITLRRRLALRYAAIVLVCLVLLVGLAHHEFVVEPAEKKRLGIPDVHELSEWAEISEVVIYAMIPVVLGFGWWMMRKTLAPITALAQSLEQIDAENLHEPLPRSQNGDEVDRLTEVFNALSTRLHSSFQQIREFTLHASHELKTPLTVMRAQLDMLLLDAKLSPEQRTWAQGQVDEVQRLAGIVDSLTLLAKATAGLVTIQRTPVRFDEIVRECYEDTLILAEPADIYVTLNTCEPVMVSGDRDRLRQLLLNLADNAVKYNQPQGTVRMALRHCGNFAELEITNTGLGIPSAVQERIFERFVRGTKAVEGCGLGLAIAKWIVQAHGGTIELATDASKLTTARVRMPLNDGSEHEQKFTRA
ncbi:MAG TPA: HAMP domain-containing sensor histidine kinase [Candidatus Acidoferrum sp.]|nr:HAMP domain-containing sensor histidine kinase [Candidatus Acidoferrum sp.]